MQVSSLYSFSFFFSSILITALYNRIQQSAISEAPPLDSLSANRIKINNTFAIQADQMPIDVQMDIKLPQDTEGTKIGFVLYNNDQFFGSQAFQPSLDLKQTSDQWTLGEGQGPEVHSVNDEDSGLPAVVVGISLGFTYQIQNPLNYRQEALHWLAARDQQKSLDVMKPMQGFLLPAAVMLLFNIAVLLYFSYTTCRTNPDLNSSQVTPLRNKMLSCVSMAVVLDHRLLPAPGTQTQTSSPSASLTPRRCELQRLAFS
ncbi:uncharacterized protein LOC131347494 [Hemibagrus wyckioides]|uniref:uncharacterized protein LOC131347494 n=1 Tax=Hemibagrus wyckioides TaxID=337641 RepID=UPI00266CD143|nr:uncharacterized protein LOC131347494 [Hemibagrus wyckioides]